jgi:hypothetical protein
MIPKKIAKGRNGAGSILPYDKIIKIVLAFYSRAGYGQP